MDIKAIEHLMHKEISAAGITAANHPPGHRETTSRSGDSSAVQFAGARSRRRAGRIFQTTTSAQPFAGCLVRFPEQYRLNPAAPWSLACRPRGWPYSGSVP